MNAAIDRRTFLSSLAATLAAPPAVDRSHGWVNGQKESAQAGLAVLAAGGNAIDAAVASALVAAVVEVHGCGIAGYGGHMVIATPKGKVTAIDFNTAAPREARPDMFPLDARGEVKGQANSWGWLAAGVPGTLAGLQLALDRYGTRRFSTLVQPAIRAAREGFPVSPSLARAISGAREKLVRDPGSRKLFFRDDRPLPAGAHFRNPDLADLLERLAARGGVDSFYRGDIGRQIAAAFARNKGLVTARDLAAYQAREVTPLSLEWQGWTIHTAPLTAGGLTILQTIATLKELGWQSWDSREFRVTQARLEAQRIAWNDRLRWLGDPEFSKVPVERLLSERYARQSAARVRGALEKNKPLEGSSDGRPADGTIHLSVADAAGMMVALTLTHGEYFGAKVTVDGLGLILGHGMVRFDPHPDRPNAPGPGKRPLHNMCPTIAVRDGQPVLALGGRGGRRIPNTVLDVLLARIGQGRSLAEAVAAPRLHTEGDTNLALEATWPAAEVKRLKEIGYTTRVGPGAVLHAIERDPRTGTLAAAGR
jgi:gamma-glutamyltranspeptidase/glutathione hydrolase